ncbi:MAG: hypothetical protein NWR72_20485 [Bacteroidia bacterium]|nr:hypothetical protein [Bacteroidia bacterium]
MQTQEILQEAKELRQIVSKAMELVEKMKARVPEMEEPAVSAQCSVIRAFLHQSVHHEKMLEEMLNLRAAS